jgi:hypothetical protein
MDCVYIPSIPKRIALEKGYCQAAEQLDDWQCFEVDLRGKNNSQ